MMYIKKLTLINKDLSQDEVTMLVIEQTVAIIETWEVNQKFVIVTFKQPVKNNVTVETVESIEHEFGLNIYGLTLDQ